MKHSPTVPLLSGMLSILLAGSAMAQSSRSGVGAIPYSNGVTFRVWAPHATNISVAGNFNGWDMAANNLAKEANGYWSADVTNAAAGAEYKYVINSNLWHKDPRGLSVVNSGGNSVVFNSNRYKWDVPSFSRPERKDMVVYKMHVLTYNPGYVQSPYGNFNMIADKLEHLQELGVNTIELMPVAEFPGNNSWGYNPADPYAVESSYGGSAEFQRFVDVCHTRKMAVIMDVVHNHWGPTDLATWQFDGYVPDVNYGGAYHYNTADLSWTPWGNSRPDYSNAEVRNYIKDSYAAWLNVFHVDGFRTDSPYHIGYYKKSDDSWPGNADGVSLMQEVNSLLHNSYSNVISIQENGDATWGFDTRWDMDFLEDLRAMVAEPSDASRDMNALAGLIESGAGLGRVVYAESHDTSGDLNGNTRLTRLIDSGDPTSFWARKRSLLAAAIYMTSPGIPMIFQGEEMAENWSFSDHTGYRWDATTSDQHRGHIAAYKDLVHARRNLKGGTQGLKGSNCDVTHVDNDNKVIAYKRWDAGGDDVVVVANFGITAWTNNNYSIEFPSAGTWYAHFNSDRTNYYSDFNQVGAATVTAAGSPPTANINMGRYSALIFSKTAPATSGTAHASPCNEGCDAPVTFHYDAAGGPLSGAAQVRVLVGHDGWQNSIYTNMTRDPLNSNEWTCAYSGFAGGTRGLNYVFTDGGGSLWDNNFSKDWYVAVACHSTARFTPAQPTGCTDVTVRYEAADGPLMTATQVYAHIGQNNWEWTANPDVPMARVGEGIWTCTFGLRDPAYNLNVCFNDGAGGWDTHFSGNWNVDVQNCHTNTGNAWIDPAQPSGCDPFTIFYSPVAGPLAGTTNVNLLIGYDGWQGGVTLPMTLVSNGLWSVVYSPLRNTDWINFCFNNGQSTWDNNYTKDWNYSVYCSPQDGLVTLSPENPVGCVPLSITYQEQVECPLENAAGIYVWLTNFNGSIALDGALPMTEVSNGFWRTEFYPPPGVGTIGLYFHDNQGNADYLRKTEYWYTGFQNCRMAGMLVITNPLSEWFPLSGAGAVTLRGQMDGTQYGDLYWTNAMTGQHGSLVGTSPWEIANVALQPGTNSITVGAQIFGAPAFDSPTNSAYQDGWQVGDNGGFGFDAWQQYSSYVPLITVSTSSELGAKAWQFNKPNGAESYFYLAERALLNDLLPGDSFRFKINTESQGQGLYLTVDFLTKNGSWLGSLQFAPNDQSHITIMSTDYGMLALPDSTSGYECNLEISTATSSVLRVTSISSGQSVQTPIRWIEGDETAVHCVSFFCMNYDYKPNSEFIQLSDFQVVPGSQGQWQSDTVHIISTAAQDQDIDGMPDDWETAHGLNADLSNADADDDGDGRSNFEEYGADTHPRNSNSLLRINQVYVVSNALQLSWQGGSNVQQVLQCSSNLAGWRDVLTNRPPTLVTNGITNLDLCRTNWLYFRLQTSR